MSVQVQLRRDTLANIQIHSGALGEVFISTDSKELFIQDGATNGGFVSSAARGIFGESLKPTIVEQLLSGLSGVSATSTIQIPVGAIVIGVSCRVITAITGAGGFWVDPVTDFGSGSAYTANGKFGFVAAAVNTTNPGIIGPSASYFTSTIILTGRNAANTANANFTAGAVRIAIMYLLVTPPTS